MRVRDALSSGVGATASARRYVLLAYLGNVAAALPLAAALAKHLHGELGNSVAAENLRLGFDDLWHRGFAAEAEGLAQTFDAGVVGIGAPLGALDALSRGALFELHPAIIAAGLVYLALWVLLSGGFIARFAGSTGGFAADAVRNFKKMAALAGIAGVAYVIAFRFVFAGLSDAVDALTYETTDERVHLGYTLAKYAVVWTLVWSVSLVADYARIAAVLCPRDSVATALRRGLTTVAAHPRRVFGLSAGLGAISVVALVTYACFAPGANQHNGFQILMAFGISQVYILAKVAVRCLGYASQTALGRGLIEPN